MTPPLSRFYTNIAYLSPFLCVFLQTVKAFTNTEEDEDGGEGKEQPMDTSEGNDGSIPANTPFLERPEGQLLVSRILQAEKKSGARKSSLLNAFYPMRQ